MPSRWACSTVWMPRKRDPDPAVAAARPGRAARRRRRLLDGGGAEGVLVAPDEHRLVVVAQERAVAGRRGRVAHAVHADDQHDGWLVRELEGGSSRPRRLLDDLAQHPLEVRGSLRELRDLGSQLVDDDVGQVGTEVGADQRVLEVVVVHLAARGTCPRRAEPSDHDELTSESDGSGRDHRADDQTAFAFIRHGQTDWNNYAPPAGSSDIPLNDAGEGARRTRRLRKVTGRSSAMHTASSPTTSTSNSDPPTPNSSSGITDPTRACRRARWWRCIRPRLPGSQTLAAAVERGIAGSADRGGLGDRDGHRCDGTMYTLAALAGSARHHERVVLDLRARGARWRYDTGRGADPSRRASCRGRHRHR